MNARQTMMFSTVTVLGLVATLAGAAPSPNILFFLADDLGWRDTACYGSEFYETPAIDRLAAEGVRFTQAYAAHPRCVPSRAALMTGKFPARLKSPGPWEGALPLSEVTIAEALKEAGYVTFFAGKWHLGGEGRLPSDQGFDINIAGGHAGAPRSYFWPYNKSRSAHGEAHGIEGLDDGKEGEYLTDRLTDESLAFLRKQKGSNQPFLLFLSHYAVHTPLESKEELTAKYTAKVAAAGPFDGPGKVDEGTGHTKLHQDNPVYAGMIQSLDESMGRLLSELDALGLSDNTIVVVTSDHGGLSNCGWNRGRPLATSNAPLRAGKGHLYEGGTRIPLIVKWPGVAKAGVTTDALVANTDFYPTLLELAGAPAKPEQHLDGLSFVDALRGNPSEEKRALFWHSPTCRPYSTGDENATALRWSKWKLIDFYDVGRVELYDISTDPEEAQNLAKTRPDVAERMLARVQAWRERIDAHRDDDGGKRRIMKKKSYIKEATAYFEQVEKK